MNKLPDPLRQLDLSTLTDGCRHLSAAVVRVHAEAAAVCLSEIPHQAGVSLRVTGKHRVVYSMNWPPVTPMMRRSHGDQDEATELGACGIAFHLIQDLEEKHVIERSRKGTGFDYWLGDDDDELPFQNKARLEVSGIRHGRRANINKRVNQKLGQTRRSDAMRIPAYVIVVEFGTPTAHIEVRS